MIQINGKNGGGQILRTALTLSIITGEAFHIKNIRGQRKKSGLMRQHLACVKAAVEVSNAATDGAELDSNEFIFSPNNIQSGDFHFRIGSAGSTTLLAQTIIPALLYADEKSTVTIEGGTHNPLAPSAFYLEKVFLPQIRKMGAEVKLKFHRYGFAPAGGGIISLAIQPCEKLTPLHLMERGKEIGRSVICHLAHIKETVALREIKTACKVLGWRDAKSETITIKKLSSGPGNCLNVMAEFNNVTAVTTAHGAHGVTSERVARNAAKTMGKFLNSGASIDHQLADQLLLPLALAGEGSYLTTPPTNHMLTNREVIEKFLPVEINFAETSNHLYQTTISHNK